MWLRVMLVLMLSLVPSAEAGAYTAYVSNERSNTVSVIDTNKWEVVKTIKVGQRPRGIAHTKDQKYVLVAVGDDDTIQMIDTGTNQVVGTLPSGPDPELFVEARGQQYRDDHRYPEPRSGRRHSGRRRARGHGDKSGWKGAGQYIRDDQYGPLHRYIDAQDCG